MFPPIRVVISGKPIKISILELTDISGSLIVYLYPVPVLISFTVEVAHKEIRRIVVYLNEPAMPLPIGVHVPLVEDPR